MMKLIWGGLKQGEEMCGHASGQGPVGASTPIPLPGKRMDAPGSEQPC